MLRWSVIAGKGSVMSHINVKLRCSVVVFREDSVLLVHRDAESDWVLPGGTPQPGEDIVACIHRELREETGMLVEPGSCALVVEIARPNTERLLDLVFLSPTSLPAGQPRFSEWGRGPEFIRVEQLPFLQLHPPLARHLKSLHQRPRPIAPQHIWHDEQHLE